MGSRHWRKSMSLLTNLIIGSCWISSSTNSQLIHQIQQNMNSNLNHTTSSLLTKNPCAIGVNLTISPQLWIDEEMDEYIKTLGNQTILVSFFSSLQEKNSINSLKSSISCSTPLIIISPSISNLHLDGYAKKKKNHLYRNTLVL